MLAWVRVVRISATMYEHVQGGPSNLHDTTHASPSSLAAAALHEADMLTLTPLRGGAQWLRVGGISCAHAVAYTESHAQTRHHVAVLAWLCFVRPG